MRPHSVGEVAHIAVQAVGQRLAMNHLIPSDGPLPPRALPRRSCAIGAGRLFSVKMAADPTLHADRSEQPFGSKAQLTVAPNNQMVVDRDRKRLRGLLNLLRHGDIRL